jgi:GT2 family glycosyltransferase
MMIMGISASVVLYNTKSDQILRIVNSFAPNEERYLYVIDNSETETDLSFLDDSNLRYIEYIFVKSNIGYGAGHNIALREAVCAGYDYHLVLNPDVEFDTAILSELTSFLDDNDEVVYLLPKVLYRDGELQYLCKLLPTPFQMFARRFLPKIHAVQKIDDRFTLKISGYNKIFNPPCLSGCFMLMRISAIEGSNLYFDERFFMYYEDFDLIRRFHRIGKTIYYPHIRAKKCCCCLSKALYNILINTAGFSIMKDR